MGTEETEEMLYQPETEERFSDCVVGSVDLCIMFHQFNSAQNSFLSKIVTV